MSAPTPGYSSSTSSVCGTFTDLEEYWPYKIRLLPLTKAGDGPSSETEEFRTLEAGWYHNFFFYIYMRVLDFPAELIYLFLSQLIFIAISFVYISSQTMTYHSLLQQRLVA